MMTTEVRCLEPDCSRVMRSMHGQQELLCTPPARDEFACFGWLKQKAFLDGFYVEGTFGGKVVLEGEREEDIQEKRNAMVREGRNVSFGAKVNGKYVVVEIPKEVKDKRKEVLKEGRWRIIVSSGLKFHEPDVPLYGPRYCEDHAIEHKLACPQCHDPLIRANTCLFGNLKSMSDRDFMRAFLYEFVA